MAFFTETTSGMLPGCFANPSGAVGFRCVQREKLDRLPSILIFIEPISGVVLVFGVGRDCGRIKCNNENVFWLPEHAPGKQSLFEVFVSAQILGKFVTDVL